METSEKLANHPIQTAIVIGASLSGLMAAIALAEEGIRVTVIEKVDENRQEGSGLRVNGGTIGKSKTERLLKHIVSAGQDCMQLWSSIELRLRIYANQLSLITIQYRTRVQQIEQNEEEVWVVTENGQVIEGDILIGADGHNSIVRAHISPRHPHATYAGYMGWIASMSEEDLPKHLQLAVTLQNQTVEMFESSNGFKFGSIIKREVDSNEGRRVGCTWYDNKRSDLLRQLGCIEGMVVRHSLKGEDVPETTLCELAEQADSWPEPWRTAALYAIQSRTLIGIPIKEYVPDRLVKGRIAIVGDAAHVPAPVTASGFNESLQDAVILGNCVAQQSTTAQEARDVLANYESQRLQIVRQMVLSGAFYTRSFGRP